MDRPIIVAVDFDGVLCKNEFPEIGAANYEVISYVRRLQDSGIETILWTSRVDDRLAKALEWCTDYGLHFTSVNDNTPSNKEEFGTNPRKVFADVYLDDRCPYIMRNPVNGLSNTLSQVSSVIEKLGGKLV